MRMFLGLLAAFLLAAAPAHADPISAIIVAVLAEVSITVSVAAVTTFLVSTAISIGLTYIAQAIQGGPKAAQPNPFGITTTLQAGGVVPRKFIIGTFATGGSEIYPARTWGQSGKTPNAYFSRFIALCDLPMNGLAGIIVDGKVCTYGSGVADANLGYAIPEYNKDGADHLWVKFYNGTQTEADGWACSQFGSDPDYPYGTDQVGHGVAYAIVTALIEPTLFSSFPAYVFVVEGISLYDPRADDSVGGSGPQRWADPATWLPTANPAVVKYNVLRGISWPGPDGQGQWLYGLQATAAGRLPLDNWFAAMNVDDFQIAYQTDLLVPQFRCGGEISVDTAAADLIDELNMADNGRVVEIGGIFKTRSGPVAAAVMSFTDADLMSTEAKNFDPFQGLESTTNGVTATYPEPVQNWAMTDAPALFDAALEADDGGRRLIASVAYNLVPFGDQVQFLMKSARDEARKFRKHTVIAPPFAAQLEPEIDAVAWTSDENGYTAKLFTVVPTDQDNVDQGLVLQEVDPADYDWDPAVHYRSYAPIPISPRAPGVQAMSGWAVSGETIDGGGGRQYPGIRISWDTAGIADVNGVLYQVRLASDSSLILSGETDHFDLGTIVVSQNLLGDTNYQARGKYRPTTPNRETDWSSWLSVTTPPQQIVADDIANAILTFGKFAASITPVQVVAGIGSAVTGEGNMAVDTTTGKLYRYHSGAWTAAVPSTDITGGGVIGLGASLPGSGTQGDVFFLTTTNKLYRYTGSAWTVSTDGGDISANSIGAGALAAGSVTAGKLAANAVTAGTVAANAITSGTIAAGAISVGTEIVSNLIVTGHLVSSSVSTTSGAYNSGGDASVSVTVSSDAYAVIITANADDGATGIFGLEIDRDGSPITSIFVAYYSGSIQIIDNPGAGTYTYSLNSSGAAAQSTIVVQQLKR